MADTLDDHAPALARACAARQLLVFAGSGILEGATRLPAQLD